MLKLLKVFKEIHMLNKKGVKKCEAKKKQHCE